jgi:hypothetical protein
MLCMEFYFLHRNTQVYLSDSAKLHATTRKGGYTEILSLKMNHEYFFMGLKNLNSTSCMIGLAAILGRKVKTRFLLDSLNSLANLLM